MKIENSNNLSCTQVAHNAQYKLHQILVVLCVVCNLSVEFEFAHNVEFEFALKLHTTLHQILAKTKFNTWPYSSCHQIHHCNQMNT